MALRSGWLPRQTPPGSYDLPPLFPDGLWVTLQRSTHRGLSGVRQTIWPPRAELSAVKQADRSRPSLSQPQHLTPQTARQLDRNDVLATVVEGSPSGGLSFNNLSEVLKLFRERDKSHADLLSEVLIGQGKEIALLGGDSAAEWVDMLYEHRALGSTDESVSLQITRLLVKLILNSGSFPRTIMLSAVTRDVDNKGRICDVVFQGGFGDVYKGRWGSQVVALKALRPIVQETRPRRKAFAKEVLVLSELRHSFIVPCLGVCKGVDGLGTTPCIVFPWYRNGTLEGYLRNTQHNDRELQTWTLELVRGMAYLHGRPTPVLHGDLRAGNILLDDELHVRIADFGLAQLEHQTQTMTKTSGAGTLQWKAPEMFAFEEEVHVDDVSSVDYGVESDGDEEDETEPISRKSKATDVWAVGCTIYEIYEGKIPYHYLSKGNETNDWRVLDSLRRGKPPALVRPDTTKRSRTTMAVELWEIVNSCWSQDPNQRPAMSELQSRMAGVGL